MRSVLPHEALGLVSDRLGRANREFANWYPGESGLRQPVHTVYGGAHLFKADSAKRLGELSVRALEQFAPQPGDLADALGLASDLAEKVHQRVREKLAREAVEDFRIDYEDGYGNRPDAEEDGHAESVALEVARGMAGGTLPPFIGIRIKPFSEELKARGIRTLDIFLATLLDATGGKLPGNFVVTLPKIVHADQVTAMVDLFEAIEASARLPRASLTFEFMIETPQSIVNSAGESNLPKYLDAARGRCVAAHFGVYDYTASCSVTAAEQGMTHPACGFARHMMQVAFAGTGVRLSDGATNIMPVPVHRADANAPLSPQQAQENRASVWRAWRKHYDDVRYSLRHAYYQGWDLHPGQFVSRYAALYAFFLESLEAASSRLRNFIDKAAKATLIGDVFDDAATGQGLLNYFLRATNCGAITETEAERLSGLSVAELRGGSFVKIVKARTQHLK
jgi:citrate lyase beta subunit